MPRVNYFGGSPGSTAVSSSPIPHLPDYQDLADGVNRSVNTMANVFFPSKATRAEALLRQAEAAKAQQDVKDKQNADSARSGLASDLTELNYRLGSGSDGALGTQPYDVAESAPVAPATARAAAAYPEPSDSTLRQRGAGQAYLRAAAGGGDAEKSLTPIMQAFMLSNGDDEGIVRTNAAMKATYLAKDASPSLARQDMVREDEQQHDTEKQVADLRMKKYGFDTESQDRRYAADTSAATARADTAAHIGEDHFAHVNEHTDRVRGQDMTDARAAAPTETSTTTTVTPANPGHKTNALTRFFGDQDTAATPATRKTTQVKTPQRKADPLGIR